MTEKERVAEWVRWYRAGPELYEFNSLIAVYKSDGEAMLLSVLDELGLQRSVDLVKDALESRS